MDDTPRGSSAGAAEDATFVRRAIALAERGIWPDPNPRVGCVIVDAAGGLVAEAWHRGAGTPHAEAVALAAAGDRARGATAYVSLEPCVHTGRTGPCAPALAAAGIVRVVYAQDDPNAEAAGGAGFLRSAGVEVVGGVLADEAAALNARWARTIALRRPLVTWKFAATLDGRSAAADGSSRWITGAEARADVHAQRAGRDAIVAGTGTVLMDDPRLTARPEPGRMPPGSVPRRQPLRVVVGLRDVPSGARVHTEPGEAVHLRTRDPQRVLAELWKRDVRDVWLEGGPTLAAAFLAADLVDEVYAYLAPAFLGAGAAAVGDLGVRSMEGIRRLEITDVRQVGGDVRIHATPVHPAGGSRGTMTAEKE
ncbi:bifunctional diaminohydroxyphosphoribosylaminopyrimidine deaminase/5-amino-6-(5-phosphoribosylamino)uracil reductase RibD [Intrasporangium sp. DVR]|uniref:bifunctional diaminohydroxyphosphoribosylaminopyrimidine deaminase/5-amino-6-(5-phosphoribosylamino)uracil reductase RibD n=1 Tax=Intrasporangium sp. DVR TaxID=3127867 RepID=UPI00313A58F9